MRTKITSTKENTSEVDYSTTYSNYQNPPLLKEMTKIFNIYQEQITNMESSFNAIKSKAAYQFKQNQQDNQKTVMSLSQFGREFQQNAKIYLKQDEKQILYQFTKKVLSENIEMLLAESSLNNQRGKKQLGNLKEDLNIINDQIDMEVKSRQKQWLKLIQCIEKDILDLQNNIKQIKYQDDLICEEMELHCLSVSDRMIEGIEKEKKKRQSEHGLLIQLISQCIEKVKASV